MPGAARPAARSSLRTAWRHAREVRSGWRSAVARVSAARYPDTGSSVRRSSGTAMRAVPRARPAAMPSVERDERRSPHRRIAHEQQAAHFQPPRIHECDRGQRDDRRRPRRERPRVRHGRSEASGLSRGPVRAASVPRARFGRAIDPSARPSRATHRGGSPATTSTTTFGHLRHQVPAGQRHRGQERVGVVPQLAGAERHQHERKPEPVERDGPFEPPLANDPDVDEQPAREHDPERARRTRLGEQIGEVVVPGLQVGDVEMLAESLVDVAAQHHLPDSAIGLQHLVDEPRRGESDDDDRRQAPRAPLPPGLVADRSPIRARRRRA